MARTPAVLEEWPRLPKHPQVFAAGPNLVQSAEDVLAVTLASLGKSRCQGRSQDLEELEEGFLL